MGSLKIWQKLLYNIKWVGSLAIMKPIIMNQIGFNNLQAINIKIGKSLC